MADYFWKPYYRSYLIFEKIYIRNGDYLILGAKTAMKMTMAILKNQLNKTLKQGGI